MLGVEKKCRSSFIKTMNVNVCRKETEGGNTLVLYSILVINTTFELPLK